MNRYLADAWSLYDTVLLDVGQYCFLDMGLWEGYASLVLSIREDHFILKVSLDNYRKYDVNMEGLRIWFEHFFSYPPDKEFEIELRPEFEMDFDIQRHEFYKCVLVL